MMNVNWIDDRWLLQMKWKSNNYGRQLRLLFIIINIIVS